MDPVYIAYLDYVSVYAQNILDNLANFLFSPGVFPFMCIALLIVVIDLVRYLGRP